MQGKTERQAELAQFLRARRERITPDRAGMIARGRRRTPGLRREEVADLIGVSPTWYTWLEQGRDIHVSSDVLEHLARVFQLSVDERIHLFLLAGRPVLPEAASPDPLPPRFHAMLTALMPAPAHIRDQHWNVLAWNAAESLVTDWASYPLAERNVVWHHFAHANLRHLMVNWEEEARTLLALFRLESGTHLADPWMPAFIERLRTVSKEFREWWPLHEVRQQREMPITFMHPEVGEVVLQPVTLVFAPERHLSLRALLAQPETDALRKLQMFAQNRQ
jgi:transcriptional regulator with XRE-family HTH domain